MKCRTRGCESRSILTQDGPKFSGHKARLFFAVYNLNGIAEYLINRLCILENVLFDEVGVFWFREQTNWINQVIRSIWTAWYLFIEGEYFLFAQWWSITEAEICIILSSFFRHVRQEDNLCHNGNLNKLVKLLVSYIYSFSCLSLYREPLSQLLYLIKLSNFCVNVRISNWNLAQYRSTDKISLLIFSIIDVWFRMRFSCRSLP